MKRRLLNRLFSAVAAFSLFLNSFLTPLIVYAQESETLEPTPTVEESLVTSESPTPLPEPTPTLEPTPVSTEVSTPTSTLEPIPTETPLQPDLEEPQEQDSSAEVVIYYWQENTDGSVTTINPVGVGIEYKYKETQVKVVFTKLTNPGHLTIKEVTLSDEQKEELGAIGDTAYDISSDMQDGSFLYDLTLPNPDTTKDFQVKYSEDGNNFQDIASETNNGVLVIKDLNHFTVFVVADPSVSSVTGSGGVWVNRGNIYASDDLRARTELTFGEVSKDLIATGFGLSIPTNAIISGIKVSIEKSVNISRPNASKDNLVSLVVGGIVVGNNNADPSYFNNLSDSISTYGSSSDMWGLTLTPLQVNAGDFGVAYAAERHPSGSSPQRVRVDQIQIEIYYNTPPSIPLLVSPGDGAHIKPSSAILDWAEVVDVDGDTVTYNYKSSWSGGGHYGPVSTGTNHWINASGSLDRTYSWQVQACDPESCSDWSGPWTVTIDRTAPTADLIFPVPGMGSTSFQVEFSEDVNQSEAEDASNYFLNNWPGAGGSGDLVGDATISYDAETKTSAVTFVNPGWYISPEQEWGVQNIHDLAGNLLTPNPTEETSTPMVSPLFSGTPSSLPNPTNSLSQLWSWSASTDPGGANASGVKGYYQRVWSVDLSDYSGEWSWIGNVLSSTTSLNEGDWKLFVKSEDNAGNQSDESESSVFIVDTTSPSAPILESPLDGSFVNGASVTNLWTEASDAVKYIYESYHDADAINLRWHQEVLAPTHSKTAINVSDAVFWWRVKSVDAAGNESDWSDLWKITVDNTLPVVVSVSSDGQIYSLESGNPTIQVTFSEDISNVPTIGINPVIPIEYQSVDDCYDEDLATFCFDYSLASDQEEEHRIYISGAEDLAGNAMLDDSTHTFDVDTLRPTVLSAETHDADNDGYIDTIKLTFSENIDDDRLGEGSDGWSVDGYTVSSVVSGEGHNDGILYLNLDEGSSYDTGVTPNVSYIQDVCDDDCLTSTHDIAGNELDNTSITADDYAEPTIVSAETQDTSVNRILDGIKLTFSEAIDDGMLEGIDELLHWTVGDYTLSSVDSGEGINDDVIYIRLSEKTDNDTGVLPSVSYLYTLGPTSVHDLSSQSNELIEGTWETLDKASPFAVWVSPAEGAVISGIASLEVNALDNDTTEIKDVLFEYKRNIEEAEWQEIYTDVEGPYLTDWNTTGLPLDAYTLRATVSDNAENATIIERVVEVAAVVSGENGIGTGYTSATITWTTDRPTSSRVVYDVVSHSSLGLAPNYGYAFSTGTSDTDPKVLSHSVTITGLNPGTIYYYRTVSAGSPTAVVNENTFATLSQAGAPAPGPWSGQVAGISTMASSWGDNYSLASEVVEESTSEEVTQTEEENKEVLGEETEMKEFNRNWIWVIILAVFSFIGFIYLRKRSKKS